MRSRFPLFWLALYRRRRMLTALLLGMIAFETLVVVISLTVSPQQLLPRHVRTPSGVFKAFSGSGGAVSISTYPGLLGAGLVHPFWIAVQLTIIGSLSAAAIAADVESGTVELLMVRPLSRRRLLGERTAALVLASLLATAAATLTVAVGVAVSPTLHQAVPLSGVFAAGLLGFGLALCFTGPALAVSAVARGRAQVIGAVIALGAVGFAVNFVALAWSAAASLRYLSPFHYYAPADAMASGMVEWGSLGVLVAVGLLGTVTAFALLERRDLAP